MTYADIDNPAKLDVLFTWTRIGPADTIYLRAGTYTFDYINKLVGTSANRITVKPYNNEAVIINGNLSDANAQYVDYVDLEFRTGRDPNAAATGKENNFSGSGIRLINCTVHDSEGAGFWDNADLFYGCISYNHGIVVGGTPSGHSLYTQNSNPAHKKTIKHSVFGRSANYGLHVYATTLPAVNIDILENVLLPGSTHLIGSQKADYNITYTGNHSYGLVQLGYGAHDHTNLTLTNNRMYYPTSHPFQMHRWTSGAITGNTIVAGTDGGAEVDMLVNKIPEGAFGITMNNNTYFNRSGKATCFGDDQQDPGWKTLAQWQSTYGFDANSTITLDGSSPADSAHVYPNEYAAISKRKGLVVIWNWTGAETVNVDLSDIAIDAGAEFSVINTQDPLTDIATVTMPVDKVVTFAMTGHTIAAVTGWADPASTFPTMGAFVLEYVPA